MKISISQSNDLTRLNYAKGGVKEMLFFTFQEYLFAKKNLTEARLRNLRLIALL